jgi:hypothetical protein
VNDTSAQERLGITAARRHRSVAGFRFTQTLAMKAHPAVAPARARKREVRFGQNAQAHDATTLCRNSTSASKLTLEEVRKAPSRECHDDETEEQSSDANRKGCSDAEDCCRAGIRQCEA